MNIFTVYYSCDVHSAPVLINSNKPEDVDVIKHRDTQGPRRAPPLSLSAQLPAMKNDVYTGGL